MVEIYRQDDRNMTNEKMTMYMMLHAIHNLELSLKNRSFGVDVLVLIRRYPDVFSNITILVISWTGVIGLSAPFRLSGLQCNNMGHNGHEINLW